VRRALALVALAALALPAAAFAHASLSRTVPSFRQRVEIAPTQVLLHFDQGVKIFAGDAIEVWTAGGALVSLPARQPHDTHDVIAPLRKLDKGPYTVRWHVLSIDGHVVSGVFTFGVRFDAPPPTEAFGASGPTRIEHVIRWVYFTGLALLLGGLAFRLVIVGRRAVSPEYARRFYGVTFLGAALTLEVGIAAFLLRAEDALQLPFQRLLYGDLSPIAGGTRFGEAFIAMTLGFSLVTAFVVLAWLTDRIVFLWAAFGIGLVFASGLSLSGHSAVDAGASKLSELADWVHLCAACLWLGGLVQLVLVVWPKAPALRKVAIRRFSRLASVLVALLLAAGIYLSVLRLPHLHDLWTEGYGQVLLVKLSLVALALAWGGFHNLVVRSLLDRPRVVARLPRSLAGESAVGMAVLLAAAVLVDSKPPAQPPPAPQPAVASAPAR